MPSIAIKNRSCIAGCNFFSTINVRLVATIWMSIGGEMGVLANDPRGIETISSWGKRLAYPGASGKFAVRMLGSAALSLAYVASGRADACEIAGIMDWDVAAGIALVRAAGGNVSITDRGENVVDILATNGCLHF